MRWLFSSLCVMGMGAGLCRADALVVKPPSRPATYAEVVRQAAAMSAAPGTETASDELGRPRSPS